MGERKCKMIRDILLLIIKYSTRYLICLEECKKECPTFDIFTLSPVR